MLERVVEQRMIELRANGRALIEAISSLVKAGMVVRIEKARSGSRRQGKGPCSDEEERRNMPK